MHMAVQGSREADEQQSHVITMEIAIVLVAHIEEAQVQDGQVMEYHDHGLASMLAHKSRRLPRQGVPQGHTRRRCSRRHRISWYKVWRSTTSIRQFIYQPGRAFLQQILSHTDRIKLLVFFMTRKEAHALAALAFMTRKEAYELATLAFVGFS